MKSIRFLIVAACLALTPLAAEAQTCLNPTPISCGDAVSDNSSSGSNNISQYSCFSYGCSGREKYFLLSLEHGAELTITLQPYPASWLFGWDAVLIMMPDLGGDCYPTVVNGCSDGGVEGEAEGLTGVLQAGDYFIVVDGYLGGYGDFDLMVDCNECTNCADNDSDGFDGYHSTDCPCGTDCNDTDPDRNPAALEICGDGIDQDCDGQDNSCPNCNSHLSILCGDSNSADTNNGSDILDDYCNSDFTLRGAQEYVFSITTQTAGVVDFTSTSTGGEQLDAFAFRDFGVAGVCNKDACLDSSINDTGNQRLAFWAEAGETYYISVDGRNNDRGPFDYTVACRAEECTAVSAIACGDDISGDTTGAANTVSAYRGLPWHLLGPEDVYSFTVAGNDAEVAVSLQATAGTTPDLDLVIVEDDGSGACLPDHAIAVSNFVQEPGFNPPEFLTFPAAAGATYFVVVEGYNTDDFGSYDLRVDCEVQCAPGETDCAGACIDTNTDVSNCGICGNVCQFAHAAAGCTAGSCVMGACDTGWDNCDGDPANGCEADLNSTATCGSCTNACQFAHAAASCTAGSCVIGACDANWGDCDGDPQNGCEIDLANDDSNCGACAIACTPPDFCTQGVCGQTCPGGLVRCGSVCVDTNSDVAHCGGCNNACTVTNGTPACVGGNCAVGSCDAGFGDCDSAYANGCETTLGTDLNCSRCGETCTFTHASGSCVAGSCTLGNCDTGWGDCDLNPASGCEADLASGQTCGNCSTSCQANESCQNGQCVFFCADDDGDGYQDDNCGGTDCDDGNDTIYPGAPDTCGDGVDQNCDGTDVCTCADADLDGHQDQACGGDDCNDNNGQIHPLAQEVCNDNQDNDCDSLTDCTDTDCAVDPACTCPDADGDRHQAFNCGGNDCDDSRYDVHPGAIEICGDGVDQDCDGKDRSCGEDSGCGCGAGAGSTAPAFLCGLMMLLGMLRRRF